MIDELRDLINNEEQWKHESLTDKEFGKANQQWIRLDDPGQAALIKHTRSPIQAG